jgi:flagellar biosynthesis protein FliR
MNLEQFGVWLALLIGLGAALAPVVSFLLGVVKTALGARLPARYYPAASVFIGVALAEFIAGIVPSAASSAAMLGGWREAALIGAIAGGIACKLFEYGKFAGMTTNTATSTSTSTSSSTAPSSTASSATAR